MRKLFMLLLLLCIQFTSFAQKEKDTLYITDIYKDVSQFLVSEKVLIYDSLKCSELINRFESWGGQTFRNYSEVRTSKSESQITLRYITNAFYNKMYVIMIAEFKDNKIRIRLYDDGNVNTPGSTVSYPKVKSFFVDQGLLHNPVDKIAYNPKSPNQRVFYSKRYKADLDATIDSFKTFMDNYSKSNAKSGW